MNLVSLTLTDFCCFEDAKVEFGKYPLTLVVGDNGTGGSNESGKSTLCVDALCWAMFGETAKGQSGQSVVRHGQDVAEVILTWMDCCDEHVIIRGQKDSGGSLQYLVNGQDESASDKRETQRTLERYFGFDLSSFKTILLIGQEGQKFARCSNADRRRILDELLGLTFLDGLRKKFSDRRDVLSKYISERKSALEYGLIPSVEDLELRLSETSAESKKWDQEQVELSRTRISKMYKLKAHIAELRELIDASAEQRAALLASLSPVIVLVDEAQKIVNQHEAELNGLNVRLNEFPDPNLLLADDSCPICLRSLGEQVQVVRQKRDQLRTFVNTAEVLVVEPRKRLAELKKQQKTIEAQIDSTNKQIQDRSADLKVAEQGLESLRQVDRRQNPYGKQIKSIEDALAVKRPQIEETQRLVAKDTDDLDLYGFWSKAMAKSGPFEIMLLGDTLQFLSASATGYVNSLLPGRRTIELVPSLRGSQHVLDIKISGDQQYGPNSGGAKECLDIALSLALRDLLISRAGRWPDLMVFDEAASYCDRPNMERFVTLLGEVASDKMQVLVVSHRDDLADSFDHVVRITKENGVSRIAA